MSVFGIGGGVGAGVKSGGLGFRIHGCIVLGLFELVRCIFGFEWFRVGRGLS